MNKSMASFREKNIHDDVFSEKINLNSEVTFSFKFL